MVDFTLVIAVDDRHLHQLTYSFPTWIRFKGELRICPILIIYDSQEVNPDDKRFDILKQYGNKVEFTEWNPPEGMYENQQGKMLTSLIFAPSFCVKTPWYVQIDTDSFAYNNKKWIYDDWFEDDYKFIASPWGYTKPSNAIELMDDWADNVFGLMEYPRLNIPYHKDWKRVCHRRIASWIIFCRTEWCRKMARIASPEKYYKLPVSSQDTFFCYCADRRKELYRRVRFKRFGWKNTSRTKRLINAIKEMVPECQKNGN